MALNLNDSFVRDSRMIAFSSSVVRMEEGTCLVAGLENGAEVGKPSAGVANEVFLGFALNNKITPQVLPKYEEISVPASAPYTVNLARTPLGIVGIRQVNGDLAETVDTADTNPSEGSYNISGRVLTFPAADAGKRIRATYQYSPTLIEVQALVGQTDVGADASGVVGGTGVIFLADELYITNFDPTDDWWGQNGQQPQIYTGANGLVTLKTGGTPLPVGNYVVAAPSTVTPFLGLRVRA